MKSESIHRNAGSNVIKHLMISLFFASSAVAQAEDQPARAPHLGPEECTVWKREQSFARSVAEHDAIAFADHIAEDAVFDVGRADAIRGRATIVKRWEGIIDGKLIRPRWYPTQVVLGGTGDLAWSTGPVLIEDVGSKTRDRYQVSTFRSIWRKDPDGLWRVLFDEGGDPRAASAKDVQTFDRGRVECGADS